MGTTNITPAPLEFKMAESRPIGPPRLTPSGRTYNQTDVRVESRPIRWGDRFGNNQLASTHPWKVFWFIEADDWVIGVMSGRVISPDKVVFEEPPLPSASFTLVAASPMFVYLKFVYDTRGILNKIEVNRNEELPVDTATDIHWIIAEVNVATNAKGKLYIKECIQRMFEDVRLVAAGETHPWKTEIDPGNDGEPLSINVAGGIVYANGKVIDVEGMNFPQGTTAAHLKIDYSQGDVSTATILSGSAPIDTETSVYFQIAEIIDDRKIVQRLFEDVRIELPRPFEAGQVAFWDKDNKVWKLIEKPTDSGQLLFWENDAKTWSLSAAPEDTSIPYWSYADKKYKWTKTPTESGQFLSTDKVDHTWQTLPDGTGDGSTNHPFKITKVSASGDYTVLAGTVYHETGSILIPEQEFSGDCSVMIDRSSSSRDVVSATLVAGGFHTNTVSAQYVYIGGVAGGVITQHWFTDISVNELLTVRNGEFQLVPLAMLGKNFYAPP